MESYPVFSYEPELAEWARRQNWFPFCSVTSGTITNRKYITPGGKFIEVELEKQGNESVVKSLTNVSDHGFDCK